MAEANGNKLPLYISLATFLMSMIFALGGIWWSTYEASESGDRAAEAKRVQMMEDARKEINTKWIAGLRDIEERRQILRRDLEREIEQTRTAVGQLTDKVQALSVLVAHLESEVQGTRKGQH